MVDYMYQFGLGVPVIYKIDKEWYQKSANQGNMKVQNSLGFLFDEGIGVSVDHNQLFYWYKKSASQGYSFVQYNLGRMFEYGQDLEKNNYIGLKWYRKSADNGDVGADDKDNELGFSHLELLENENKNIKDKEKLLSSNFLTAQIPADIDNASLSAN